MSADGLLLRMSGKEPDTTNRVSGPRRGSSRASSGSSPCSFNPKQAKEAKAKEAKQAKEAKNARVEFDKAKEAAMVKAVVEVNKKKRAAKQDKPGVSKISDEPEVSKISDEPGRGIKRSMSADGLLLRMSGKDEPDTTNRVSGPRRGSSRASSGSSPGSFNREIYYQTLMYRSRARDVKRSMSADGILQRMSGKEPDTTNRVSGPRDGSSRVSSGSPGSINREGWILSNAASIESSGSFKARALMTNRSIARATVVPSSLTQARSPTGSINRELWILSNRAASIESSGSFKARALMTNRSIARGTVVPSHQMVPRTSAAAFLKHAGNACMVLSAVGFVVGLMVGYVFLYSSLLSSHSSKHHNAI